jgi:hydroxymethylpyrimidine pyrophosphatase-like HAD family hydrolase
MPAPETEGPSRIRLLVLDVDGTVTNSRHEVSEGTRRAVHRIQSAGITVMLATGRRYRDTLGVADMLGLQTPLVTASGALVKQPAGHATLFRAAFAPGLLETMLGLIVAAGHEPILYTDSFAAGFDFHCRTLGDDPAAGSLREYLERNRGLARVQPDLHLVPPPDAFAGFAMGGRERMQRLEAELAAAFPGRLSLHTIRSPRYREWLCEIAPAGITKWSAVTTIATRLGVAAAEICAVGDDVNDLPMIRGAGLGVAMGNALPEVQAAAGCVVGTHDGSGIADVADMLLA